MTAVATPVRSPEREALLASVRGLQPLIQDCALQAEEERTLPLRCVDALREAELFSIASPREVGGLEVDPVTHIEIIEMVTSFDTSAGWTLMIGAHGAGMIATFAPETTCAAVFAGSRWPIAGSQMAPWAGSFRPVAGGYIVSGRWSFASGIRHADWSMVTAMSSESTGGPPAQLAAVLPVTEVTIEDNWFVSGLKGSGSFDFSLSEQFIPADMAWPMPPTQRRGGPRFRLKMHQATLAAFGLGAARRSLDDIAAQALAKRRPGYPNAVADRPYFHHFLGEAEVRLAAARAGLFQLVEQMWQLALEGRPIPVELELRLAAVPAHVHSVACELTSSAFRFAGSGAARLDNVLQRNLRDMAVAAQHIQASEQAYEVLGRSILGMS